MKDHETERVEYEKPMVVDYGELTELTASHSTGTGLDSTYTTGKTFHQLGWSG